MSKKKRPPLHPEIEAYWERMQDKSPDSATATAMRETAMPIIGKVSMEQINRERKIPKKDRDRVTDLYKKWRPDYPNETSCFNAIEVETGIKADTVRYIIKGPRRSK